MATKGDLSGARSGVRIQATRRADMFEYGVLSVSHRISAKGEQATR